MKNLLSYWLPLFILSAALWFILSGHTELLFVIYGAITVGAAIVFAYRADFADGEHQNLLRTLRLIPYLPWLLWQIVLANIDVVWRIMRGNDTISPVLFDLPISLNTEHGRTLLAQSVTLTPGTVSVIVYHEKLIIHALSHDGMNSLLDGSFEKPALWYEHSTTWRGKQRPVINSDSNVEDELTDD